MHDGEFDTGHGPEGDLDPSLGIKYVSMVDVRLTTVLVVVAQDIFPTGK